MQVRAQSSLLQGLLPRTELVADRMSPQSVANSLWSLATLGIAPNDSLLDRLAGLYLYIYI